MKQKLLQKLLGFLLLLMMVSLGYQMMLVLGKLTSKDMVTQSLSLRRDLKFAHFSNTPAIALSNVFSQGRRTGELGHDERKGLVLEDWWQKVAQHNEMPSLDSDGAVLDNRHYRVVFIRQTLDHLLTSGDRDVEKLPVKVVLNCTQGEKEAANVGNHLCIDEVDVLRMMNGLGIEFEGVTKLYLFKLVLSRLQDLHSEQIDWMKGQSQAEHLRQSVDVKVSDIYKLEALIEELAMQGARKEKDLRTASKWEDENHGERDKESEENGKGVNSVDILDGEKDHVRNLATMEPKERKASDIGKEVYNKGQLQPVEPALLSSDILSDSDDYVAIEDLGDDKSVGIEGREDDLKDDLHIHFDNKLPEVSRKSYAHYDSVAARRNDYSAERKNSRENPYSPPENYQLTKHTSNTNILDSKIRIGPIIRDTLNPSHNSRVPVKASSKYQLLTSLLKLLGYQMIQYGGLKERRFPEKFGFNASLLRDRRKYVEEVISEVDSSRQHFALDSLNTNLLKRGKYQREQTDEFCAQQKLSKALPTHVAELDYLFKHLLYDDSKRVVFCYVPKNSCSSMKRMMLILNGLLPKNSSQDPFHRPSEQLLGSVRSFRNLTKKQAIYRLENYYKFAVVRNPMERLLSAYKNKLQPPFDARMRKKFPDRLKAYILSLYDGKKLMNWIAAKNYSKDIHPSFSQFIRFMTKYSLNSYNEHFMPFMKLCYPCAINYDLLLNFKTINYDVYAAMEYLKIPPSYYPMAIAHKAAPTSAYLQQYFKQASGWLKSSLYHRLHQELDFYYAMHPEEAGMHERL